jgi:ankyrin repeat protein
LQTPIVPIAGYQTSRISLYWQVISGNLPIAGTLLTLGINVSNGGGPELLYEADSHGHIDMVSWFLRNGARLEDKGQYHGTALRSSAPNGYSAVVRFLLEQGANIEAQDIARWTPLRRTAKSGHEEVVRLLLQKGANVAAQAHDSTSVLF